MVGSKEAEMGYQGYCNKCSKCPNCKGNGFTEDKYRGRETCSRCRGVGGFPCIEHD